MAAATTCLNNPRTYYIVGLFNAIIALVVLLAVFSFAKSTVDSVTEFCQESNVAYKNWLSNKDSNTHVNVLSYIYDANPHEFLLGTGNLKLTEVGPYTYRILTTKLQPNIEGDSLSYIGWNSLEFDAGESCKGCLPTDTVTFPNFGYSRILTIAQNEGLLFLSGTCTTTQIGMSPYSAYPICSDAERGNSSITSCRCCAPYTSNVNNTCARLADPAVSTTAAMISLLAGFDGGIAVKQDTRTALRATRVISPLFITRTVRDLAMGQGSAMIGFAQVRSLPDANETVLAIAKYSQDFKTACFEKCYMAMYSTIAAITASDDPFEIIGSSRFVCNETVDTAEELIEDGLEDLVYLAETSCKPISSAFLSFKIGSSGGGFSCVIPDAGLGCCLSSGFNVNSTTDMRGLGCIAEVSGIVVAKKLVQREEAEEFLTPETKLKSVHLGCGGPVSNASYIAELSSLQPKSFEIDNNVRKFPIWYDEDDSGSFINQLDADDVYSGEMQATDFLNVEGIDVSSINKIGFHWKNLFATSMANTPSVTSFYSYNSAIRRTFQFLYKGQTEFEGLTLARFEMNPGYLLDSQTMPGNANPYYGILNDPLTAGVPRFFSSPHFVNGDAELRHQTNNSHISADMASGNGIELHTRVKEYSGGHLLSDESMAITDEWIASHDFSTWVEYEPITGFAMRYRGRGMAGIHTWSCDKSVVASCGLFPSTTLDTDCYTVSILSYGCSAANILTPYMTSRKFMPILWMEEHVDIHPTDAKMLKSLLFMPMGAVVAFIVLLLAGIVFAIVGWRMSSKKYAEIAPEKQMDDVKQIN